MTKKILIALVFFLALFVIFNKSSKEPTSDTKVVPMDEKAVTVIKEGLHVPWSLSFLPSGDILVTERNGFLSLIGKESARIKVAGVSEAGEGGLLGLAIHPEFSKNKFVYLYFTSQANGKVHNKVVRYVFDGSALTEERVIVPSIPGGRNHNGGRIAFGPDRYLYITTGDAGNEDLAQNLQSLAGKILRIKDDGSIPQDNPFGSPVYSYGHRNPQGLVWDDTGRLWETEHGRSGVQSGFDEINLIEKGGNYGWPIIEGGEQKRGMNTPILHSGPTTTWAPSGIAFKNGALYFVGLRGNALYETEVLSDGRLSEIKTRIKDTYGRLRGIAISPDLGLYITTSNRDGRGEIKQGDDKILRLSL